MYHLTSVKLRHHHALDRCCRVPCAAINTYRHLSPALETRSSSTLPQTKATDSLESFSNTRQWTRNFCKCWIAVVVIAHETILDDHATTRGHHSWNYRTVALSSVLSKLLERLLQKYLEPFIECENQFAFKASHGAGLCVFPLQECLSYYHKLRSHMFLAFLNVSAAFDTKRFNFNLLFEKLLLRGTLMYLIRLLCIWYMNQLMCVKWKKCAFLIFFLC